MLQQILSRDCDRFIPFRSYQHAETPLSFSASLPPQIDTDYSQLIKKNLFTDRKYKPETKVNSGNNIDFKTGLQCSIPESSQNKLEIGSPLKILDIPNYRDDFYLNNVDWSDQGPMGIALNNEVFIYSPQNLVQLCRSPFSSYVSSLKFSEDILAVGLSNGMIEIYDLQKATLVRTLLKHTERVSGLAFMNNNLISGSKDKSILINDLRLADHAVQSFNNHKGQICSLKQRNTHDNVFASGSNDSSAITWDIRKGMIQRMKGSKGAIKALDWCPWKTGVLATGGGSKDKIIKIWNTSTSTLLGSQTVDSQISSMLWNQPTHSLITSHGYNSNDINIWDIEQCSSQYRGQKCKLVKKHSFVGHSQRILSMVQSKDHHYFCTVSADETLKFWNMKQTDRDPFQKSKRSRSGPNILSDRLL